MEILVWCFAVIGAGALLFGAVIMFVAVLHFWRAYQVQRRMAQMIGATAAKNMPLADEIKSDIVN